MCEQSIFRTKIFFIIIYRNDCKLVCIVWYDCSTIFLYNNIQNVTAIWLQNVSHQKNRNLYILCSSIEYCRCKSRCLTSSEPSWLLHWALSRLWRKPFVGLVGYPWAFLGYDGSALHRCGSWEHCFVISVANRWMWHLLPLFGIKLPFP